MILCSLLLACSPSLAPASFQTPIHQGLLSATAQPRIGSVRVENHGNGRATVRWTTDLPTDGRIRYGLGDSLALSISDTVRSREHSLDLVGLTPKQSYGYRIYASNPKRGAGSTPTLSFQSSGAVQGSGFEVSGRVQAWFPLTVSFTGPFADEHDTNPNPFLDSRLEVDFTAPDGRSITVPGFFDGDGNGGASGNQWRVRFAPNQGGTWSFVAHFRQGTNVAVSLVSTAGKPASFDGTSGTVEVLSRDANAEGLYRWGKLSYVGEHYLKFRNGPYFIKGGSNSPENLLAFAGFDNTQDQGGISVFGLTQGLHRYRPHIRDFGPPSSGGLGTYADPLFRSADTQLDSRGLVGAINYLGSVHVNSLYFMPMNLGGDGQDVCPFIGYAKTPYDKTHYDISKLKQWNEVFEHMARNGMQLHIVLGETEYANQHWLDNGTLGTERMLYYRELIARFGHLPAIEWNLSEEAPFSTALAKQYGSYIQALDPYDHPIGFHTLVLNVSGSYPQYSAILGDPLFVMNSMQAIPYTASNLVEKWRDASAAAGHKWVVQFDEQTQALTNTNAAALRKLQLYDTLFSGGSIEWYAGYFDLPLGGDLRLENFRTREEMWNDTWYARRFLEENVPFWMMSPIDGAIRGATNVFGGPEVFALPSKYYAIYFPAASSTGKLDLNGVTGSFVASWYNPRTGSFEGSSSRVAAVGMSPLPSPPRDPAEDWVLLLQR